MATRRGERDTANDVSARRSDAVRRAARLRAPSANLPIAWLAEGTARTRRRTKAPASLVLHTRHSCDSVPSKLNPPVIGMQRFDGPWRLEGIAAWAVVACREGALALLPASRLFSIMWLPVRFSDAEAAMAGVWAVRCTGLDGWLYLAALAPNGVPPEPECGSVAPASSSGRDVDGFRRAARRWRPWRSA